jgi:hypothetical protein
MALQHIFDPAVETLDHAVGLGAHGRGQAILDVELGAEAVELVVPRRSALAQAEGRTPTDAAGVLPSELVRAERPDSRGDALRQRSDAPVRRHRAW